ncbi:TnsD family Tn7-like transposition protein [Ralstonia wenshanensis]|uniref:Transposon Tn7 transposition protein TnsD C-termianl domain-containing protein n=1 Tax=Ralstonia wenshanensis TaxID=2842456 RepID=A0AAD2ARS8_9RALS|nr:hypothetical protein LMG18091_00010 [Ralstonia wenshanensis]
MHGVLIGYMPELLPGELLYSLLARTVAANAMGPPQEYIEFFFGTKDAIPSVDVPAHIQAIHKSLGSSSPARSSAGLLEIGTTYPYHRAFITPERNVQLSAALLHGGGSGIKLRLGTIANGFGAQPALKFCPLCLSYDIATYGSGCWHKEHHLPDVTCCPTHGIRLVGSFFDSTKYRNRQRLIAPPCVPAPVSPIPQMPTAQELALAVLSRDMLYAHAQPIDPTQRINAYRIGLAELGLLGAHQRIRHEHVSAALRDFHHNFLGLPHANRLLSTETTPLAWLHRIFEKPNQSVHPICHLLLIQFLFGCVAKYLSTLESARDVVRRPSSHLAHKQDEATVHGSDYLLDPSISCRRAAVLSGSSVTTAVLRRRAAGVPVQDRRKRLNREIIQALQTDICIGMPMAQIASKHGVSLSTVYRVQWETPELSAERDAAREQAERLRRRARWLRAIQTSTVDEQTRGARFVDPAAFAWLYRHDAAWLRSVRPSPRERKQLRVDWHERDLKLCARLQKEVQRLRIQNCRRRIGRTLMQEFIGEAMIRANRARLPELCAYIDQTLESRVAFYARRVDAAVIQLSDEGIPLSPWRVRRLAGVRNWSPEVAQYACRAIEAAASSPPKRTNF